VADTTFVPITASSLFLAAVLDARYRRIVGWVFGHDLKIRVVLDALDMAVASCKSKDVIHHSDKGSRYRFWAFSHGCRAAGIQPSTGTAGGAPDNAMYESFFATLECELIDRNRFPTKAEAQIAVFRFIEGFCNSSRRHSSIGYRSPIEFETAHQSERAPKSTSKPETCR
jgi:putative transposase